MRDLVPRNVSSAPRKVSVTPWSTYVHAAVSLPPKEEVVKETPKKKPTKKDSVSPSPVAHSKEVMPLSPFMFSPVEEEGRNTPSISEFPHESIQLPRRNHGKFPKTIPVKSAIEVFEEFITDFSSEEKECVRATYNGPDWPGQKDNRVRRLSKPAVEPSLYKSFTISNQSYLLPPHGAFATTVHHNRFLVGLPSFTAPRVTPVFQYFRGC